MQKDLIITKYFAILFFLRLRKIDLVTLFSVSLSGPIRLNKLYTMFSGISLPYETNPFTKKSVLEYSLRKLVALNLIIKRGPLYRTYNIAILFQKILQRYFTNQNLKIDELKPLQFLLDRNEFVDKFFKTSIGKEIPNSHKFIINIFLDNNNRGMTVQEITATQDRFGESTIYQHVSTLHHYGWLSSNGCSKKGGTLFHLDTPHNIISHEIIRIESTKDLIKDSDININEIYFLFGLEPLSYEIFTE